MEYFKKFYSDEFLFFFSLKRNGGLAGELRKIEVDKVNSGKSFSGLFVQNGSQLSLAFFTEIAGVLTCFAGDTFQYLPNEECLLLRYLSATEVVPESPGDSDYKTALLFDCPKKKQKAETSRVIANVPEIGRRLELTRSVFALPT